MAVKRAPAIIHTEAVLPNSLIGAPRQFPSPGRSTYRPTDEDRHLVLIMRANGMGIRGISIAMRLNQRTIEKHFEKEMAEGFERVRAHVGAALVNAALSGNVAAMKFWLATHCVEWRAAAKEQVADALGSRTPDESDGEVVRFYLPSNHRDEPERMDPEPPTIDAEVAA